MESLGNLPPYIPTHESRETETTPVHYSVPRALLQEIRERDNQITFSSSVEKEQHSTRNPILAMNTIGNTYRAWLYSFVKEADQCIVPPPTVPELRIDKIRTSMMGEPVNKMMAQLSYVLKQRAEKGSQFSSPEELEKRRLELRKEHDEKYPPKSKPVTASDDEDAPSIEQFNKKSDMMEHLSQARTQRTDNESQLSSPEDLEKRRLELRRELDKKNPPKLNHCSDPKAYRDTFRKLQRLWGISETRTIYNSLVSQFLLNSELISQISSDIRSLEQARKLEQTRMNGDATIYTEAFEDDFFLLFQTSQEDFFLLLSKIMYDKLLPYVNEELLKRVWETLFSSSRIFTIHLFKALAQEMAQPDHYPHIRTLKIVLPKLSCTEICLFLLPSINKVLASYQTMDYVNIWMDALLSSLTCSQIRELFSTHFRSYPEFLFAVPLITSLSDAGYEVPYGKYLIETIIPSLMTADRPLGEGWNNGVHFSPQTSKSD